jgi:hypothetical protein
MDYFVQVFCLAGKSGFIYRFRVFGDNLNKLTEEELNNLPLVWRSSLTTISPRRLSS